MSHVLSDFHREPLLAHLRSFDGSEMLFLKGQFMCFHDEYPEPYRLTEPTNFFDTPYGHDYFNWFRKKVGAIVFRAEQSNDPRFDPLVIYKTVCELQGLLDGIPPLLP
ncbi:hypothetical protein pCXcHC2016_19 [Xenohaliotis phage pCXc-HC2016]|nr:hypothetical protein pCXcHC2016_19 [Xenohaliotis phage pCXc-HC2016]AQW89126.1 hypothetical protein pCXcHR2015_19 [Xenohaliotis phage pCXc-HR2015]